MEPISPELVLVDPELAARVRANAVKGPSYPPEPTNVVTPAYELAPPPMVRPPDAPEITAPPAGRRVFKRVRRSIIVAGLLASGFVAGSALSGNSTQRPELLAPERTAPTTPVDDSRHGRTVARKRPSVGRTKAQALRVANARRSPSSRARRRAAASKRRKGAQARTIASRMTTAAVERNLLSTIVRSPAGKLPPALIDKRTGLAKNNLQAVCTRSDDLRSFLCIVTSALQPEVGPVYAHYRPTTTSRGVFTWYPARGG